MAIRAGVSVDVLPYHDASMLFPTGNRLPKFSTAMVDRYADIDRVVPSMLIQRSTSTRRLASCAPNLPKREQVPLICLRQLSGCDMNGVYQHLHFARTANRQKQHHPRRTLVRISIVICERHRGLVRTALALHCHYAEVSDRSHDVCGTCG